MTAVDDWFLTSEERGNPATSIDRQRGDDAAWTEGNDVTVHVDGASYFRRLREVLQELGPRDGVELLDWQGDPDERLDGPGSEVGATLAAAARRGVRVQGLLWRSHPRQTHFAEQSNAALSRLVNDAGGELILDERVRRGGSHHQKLVLIRRTPPQEDLAFVGGIDLCHGRHDDALHRGDPQAADLDPRYGPTPPWHDVQLEIRGPAVGDLAHTFRERWQDATPLDHRNPMRLALRHLTGEPRHPGPLWSSHRTSAGTGTHSVQVLRTYPAKHPPFPFAPDGERSIARAYLKAFRRARSLVYIEDQYLWSRHAAHALAEQLTRHRELRVVAVVPRYPDRGGAATDAACRIGREYVTRILKDAGGERVALYDIEQQSDSPVYVHAKVCVIDDVVTIVGSSNLNRRSWTHDSEVACSVLDEARDERVPRDPGGLGDGARRLARETRLRLWREHLDRRNGVDGDLLSPEEGFAALQRAARSLDEWHQAGGIGPRPPGRLRMHDPTTVRRFERAAAFALYRALLDPDGRPAELRRADTM